METHGYVPKPPPPTPLPSWPRRDFKLNPAIKRRWVQALRSGKYQQGHRTLVQQPPPGDPSHKQYCCLGVLCEAAQDLIPLSPELVKTILRPGAQAYIRDANCQYLVLPYEVQTYLANLNDNQGRSFENIADIIEANL